MKKKLSQSHRAAKNRSQFTRVPRHLPGSLIQNFMVGRDLQTSSGSQRPPRTPRLCEISFSIVPLYLHTDLRHSHLQFKPLGEYSEAIRIPFVPKKHRKDHPFLLQRLTADAG